MRIFIPLFLFVLPLFSSLHAQRIVKISKRQTRGFHNSAYQFGLTEAHFSCRASDIGSKYPICSSADIGIDFGSHGYWVPRNVLFYLDNKELLEWNWQPPEEFINDILHATYDFAAGSGKPVRAIGYIYRVARDGSWIDTHGGGEQGSPVERTKDDMNAEFLEVLKQIVNFDAADSKLREFTPDGEEKAEPGDFFTGKYFVLAGGEDSGEPAARKKMKQEE